MHTNGMTFPAGTKRLSVEDATMGSTCDIFKVTPDGPPWVEAVQGLSEAKERIASLAVTFPGEYFIYSRGQTIAATVAQEWADVV